MNVTVSMDVIQKIGAIILKDKKILVCKKKNKYIIPGGKPEIGENNVECLRRELKEELNANLVSQEFFATYEDDAALDIGKIRMDVYLVEIDGTPKPGAEIEQLEYVEAKNNLELGSILEKFVIPALKIRRLID